MIRFRENGEDPRMAGSRREEHGAIRCPQGRRIQKEREASRDLVADTKIYDTGDFRNERSRPCIPRAVVRPNRETRSHFRRSFLTLTSAWTKKLPVKRKCNDERRIVVKVLVALRWAFRGTMPCEATPGNADQRSAISIHQPCRPEDSSAMRAIPDRIGMSHER